MYVLVIHVLVIGTHDFIQFFYILEQVLMEVLYLIIGVKVPSGRWV